MRFSIQREVLFKPLQRVAGAVDKRPVQKPILSNILFSLKNDLLSLVGTDQEIEMIARVPISGENRGGEITVGAKKLIDICRALPDETTLVFECQENKMSIKAGKSRYTLACLPAEDFPVIAQTQANMELSVTQSTLRQLFQSCGFALSQNLDVARYYLNGICLIFESNGVRVVATDGHRLATIKVPMRLNIEQSYEVIIPKKAAFEMHRLFSEGEEEVGLVLGENHLRAITTGYSFVTKLIEGKFPSYKSVLPSVANNIAVLPREAFKDALTRVSALFTDKHRGVRLCLLKNILRLTAVNADKDESIDEIEIDYTGEELEIGFNVSYLLEYLSAVTSEKIKVILSDPNSSTLFEACDDQDLPAEFHHHYVVMPMRI